MILSLVLDVVVALLLAGTITYCALLNHRLQALRDDKGEMQKVVDALNQAAARAEAGIAGLKTGTAETGQELQETLEKARSLADDLVFLIERGEKVAGRLEKTERPTGRAETSTAATPRKDPRTAAEKPKAAPREPTEPPADDDADTPARVQSEAEKDLIRALQAAR